MTLTGTMLRDALDKVGAVGSQLRTFDELATGGDGALRQAPAGLTYQGAASFLATMAQESAYFRTTTEYGSGQSYAPYVGRTFEQVTYRDNYARFGAWCVSHGLLADADYFANNPTRLSDYGWAWLGGVWYFEYAGLWPYANRGDHYAVSQGVNRGPAAIGTTKVPNGWNERKAMYDALVAQGAALLPSGSPGADLPTLRYGDQSENVRRFQDWSNWYSWSPALPVVAETGYYGNDTKELVRRAQAQMGVTGSDADGSIIGPRTNAALAARGYPNKS